MEEYKHKYKILLETETDVIRFVHNILISQAREVFVIDGKGLKVSAKSVLGMMYALTFTELWCVSDTEIYNTIRDFVL